MTTEGKGQGAASRPEKRAERRFDAFDLAARQAVIEGHVDANTLPRVDDLLTAEGADADLAYRIRGSADAALRPALEVSLSGLVPLTCQRCLRPFSWPVDQRTLLLLARDQAELARLDEEDHEHEVILANAPVDVLELVEDELLLTLPFAPRCPDESCPAVERDESGAKRPASERSTAFDVLAVLKTGSPPKLRR